jgi:hypothetical protein
MTTICTEEQIEKEIDKIIDDVIKNNLSKTIDKTGLRPLIVNVKELLKSYIDVPNHIDTYLKLYTGQWGSLIANPVASSKAFFAFNKMQNSSLNINKEISGGGNLQKTMSNIGNQLVKSAIQLKDNFNIAPLITFLKENQSNSKELFKNFSENEQKVKKLANEMGLDNNLFELLNAVYKIKKQLSQDDFKTGIATVISDKLKKICKQFDTSEHNSPIHHDAKSYLIIIKILEYKNIYYKYIQHIFEIILK